MLQPKIIFVLLGLANNVAQILFFFFYVELDHKASFGIWFNLTELKRSVELLIFPCKSSPYFIIVGIA